MWIGILVVSLLIAAFAAIYLARKVKNTGLFSFTQKPAFQTVLSFIAVFVFLFILSAIFDVTNTIVIVVHVATFLLVGDLVRYIIQKAGGVSVSGRAVDLVAIIACIAYLAYGWVLMHGLWETDYHLLTTKPAGEIKVAQIADSHIGAGFDGKGFGQRLSKIQESDPDILVITGDFVDDSTTKQDMIDACSALGDFRTKYGVYFCFGNHDRGYNVGRARGFSGDDLVAELKKNGVIVLEDESVLVDDRFYVIGRADAGFDKGKRTPIADLIADLDKDKYMIVLDHQPTDYDAEEAAGVDLVLSGHTHGGQVFPLEYIQPLVSENDNVRGLEHRGNTDFIVTDGISDWAIVFRTGCRSEYNIIDIKQ